VTVPDSQVSTAPAWLVEDWVAQLTRAIESMVGEAPKVTSAAHELSAEELETDGIAWREQVFSLNPDAQVWIGAAPQTWQEIGTRVLKSAGVEEQDNETVRGTYFEIVSQALSGLAGAISERVRQEVSPSSGRDAPPAVSAGATGYQLDVAFGETVVPLLAAFHTFWSSVSFDSAAEDQPKADHAAIPKPPAVPSKPSTIDLLVDVELPVSVSFGRAQLPLKDVIKLTTGSIVELNRAVSEPVEVIVNNCVIARGEVVVVEGNFGIRIKEVVSRQERLRTLN